MRDNKITYLLNDFRRVNPKLFYKHILFVCATDDEKHAFLQALKLNNIAFDEDEDGCVYFNQGYHFCFLVQTGISYFNVIMKLPDVVAHIWKPDLVINVGTCAGLCKQPIGSVIVSNNCVCADLDLSQFGYLDGRIIKEPREESMPIIASGSRFLSSKSEIRKLKERFPGVVAFDMETYALSVFCEGRDIPFLSVRAVSDNGDENAGVSYEQIAKRATLRSSLYALQLVLEKECIDYETILI